MLMASPAASAPSTKQTRICHTSWCIRMATYSGQPRQQSIVAAPNKSHPVEPPTCSRDEVKPSGLGTVIDGPAASASPAENAAGNKAAEADVGSRDAAIKVESASVPSWLMEWVVPLMVFGGSRGGNGSSWKGHIAAGVFPVEDNILTRRERTEAAHAAACAADDHGARGQRPRRSRALYRRRHARGPGQQRPVNAILRHHCGTERQHRRGDYWLQGRCELGARGDERHGASPCRSYGIGPCRATGQACLQRMPSIRLHSSRKQ